MPDVVEHFDGQVKTLCRHNRREVPVDAAYTAAAMALRVKEIRKERRLSQEQLAAMAGLSRSQLSEIETEAKPANTLRLAAIAKALGVTVPELFANPTSESYEAMLLDLMRGMTEEDRKALIHYARAMAQRRD